MQTWQKVARRIRVPLGFLTAVLYVFELWRRPPCPHAIAWSLALVLPGLWLRAYASGYVKKNTELTVTGPYAHTRNPLYLGSMLMAGGFALALGSWIVAAVLTAGFILVYVPVIAGEEAFLHETFSGFAAYCQKVPRLIPRFTPARFSPVASASATSDPEQATPRGRFSFPLYLQHREYNAAIGVVLLYLCLLGFHPLLSGALGQMR